MDAKKAFATRISFEVDGITAMAILGNLQLALRHHKNTGESSKVAKAFALDLQQSIERELPEVGAVLQMGWDPNFDID